MLFISNPCYFLLRSLFVGRSKKRFYLEVDGPEYVGKVTKLMLSFILSFRGMVYISFIAPNSMRFVGGVIEVYHRSPLVWSNTMTIYVCRHYNVPFFPD